MTPRDTGQAKNTTAAKLYLNWQLSDAQQRASFNGWSVRTDTTLPAGLRPIWEYPNANIDGFPRFMADRAEVDAIVARLREKNYGFRTLVHEIVQSKAFQTK